MIATSVTSLSSILVGDASNLGINVNTTIMDTAWTNTSNYIPIGTDCVSIVQNDYVALLLPNSTMLTANRLSHRVK